MVSVLAQWTSSTSAQESGGDAPKRDVYDLPTPVAIQGRTNKIDQSFSISAGYIQSDSFNRSFPVAGTYSFYFTPYFAWEILSYSYNFNRETQLKEDIKNLAGGVQNTGLGGVLDFPRHVVMSGVIYTPLYSKSLLFSKTLAHSDTGFYLGAGSMVFSELGHRPAIAMGIQTRYFLSSKSAVRLYLRQYLFNDTKLGLTGMTDIGLGYEAQLGLLSRHVEDDE